MSIARARPSSGLRILNGSASENGVLRVDLAAQHLADVTSCTSIFFYLLFNPSPDFYASKLSLFTFRSGFSAARWNRGSPTPATGVSGEGVKVRRTGFRGETGGALESGQVWI